MLLLLACSEQGTRYSVLGRSIERKIQPALDVLGIRVPPGYAPIFRCPGRRNSELEEHDVP